MRLIFRKTLVVLIMGALLSSNFGVLVQAQNSVTLGSLQENINYLFPGADYVFGLESHSTWRELSRVNMVETSGIEVTYEAIFDQAPNQSEELPTINVYLISAVSQDAAAVQFSTWANSSQFKNGKWQKITEGKDYFTYYAGSGSDNDLIKYRSLEEGSLHLVSYYDNILMVVNFYRTSGQYLRNNVSAYLGYLDDEDGTLSVLNEIVVYCEEALKFYLGTTFSLDSPSDYEYFLKDAQSNYPLSENFDIPLNGSLSFDVSLNDASEIGQILSMNNPSKSSDVGILSLGLDQNAIAKLRFYDPIQNSSCRDAQGWHQLSTITPLGLYEWQNIEIRYGMVDGLSFWLNGEKQGSCDLVTARSNKAIYLGDYPSDGAADSFVGYVKNIKTGFSRDDSGNIIDSELIFKDVGIYHPHAPAIQAMKDQQIMVGYEDGTFRPEKEVNRAEILKILLLGFDYKIPANDSTKYFKDLEEGAWYLSYLNYAVSKGIISGYPDGTYQPGNTVNRVEFLKILANAYGLNLTDYPLTSLYLDVSKDDWFAVYVQYAKDHNLMDPDLNNNFNPGEPVTRAEVSETIYRLLFN